MLVGISFGSLMRLVSPSLFVCVVGLLIAGSANAQFTVDFNEYGTPGNPPDVDNDTTIIIDSEYETGGADNTNSPLPAGFGFSVTTSGGANATGDLTLYDSNITNGNDDDLENLVDGDGNSVDLGNLLISQESGNTDGDGLGDGPGTGYEPDDHINAIVVIDFETPIAGLGWAFADNDAGTEYTLTDSAGNTLSFTSGDLVDPASPFFQGSQCLLGDSGTCRISTFTAGEGLAADLNDIDTLTVAYVASGGLGELSIIDLRLGNITGNVSEDTNNDGAGDVPLSGVTLELFTDPNGDGDPSDGVSLGTTTTNGSGDYAFNDVPFGDYVVVESQPLGFADVSENEGGADNDQPNNGIPNAIAVTVSSSDPDGVLQNEDQNNDFVEVRLIPDIEIQKTVYLGNNGGASCDTATAVLTAPP